MKISAFFYRAVLTAMATSLSLNVLAENVRLIKASAKLDHDQGALYYEFTITQSKPSISVKNAKLIMFIKSNGKATQVIKTNCTDKNDILKNLEQKGRFELSSQPDAKSFFALTCTAENKGQDLKAQPNPFGIFVLPSGLNTKVYDFNKECKTNFLGTSQPIFGFMPNICYEDFSTIENPEDYILKELSN